MELTDRQVEIAEMVRDQEFLTVEMLAEQFQVTTQTIRRDLNMVCDRGLARRRHGGIECLPDKSNLSFSTRRILNLAAKRILAKELVKHVPDGASLAFSIGTTPVIVTEALLGHKELSIFTNNLNVAIVASRNPDFKVHIAGGTLRNHDLDILGTGMVEFFSSYKVDIGIYGVGGIDETGVLLDFSEDEVLARQLIQKNSRSTFLVLDESKFGRRAHVRGGGHICDATKVFCDKQPGEKFQDTIKDAAIHFVPSPLEAAL